MKLMQATGGIRKGNFTTHRTTQDYTMILTRPQRSALYRTWRRTQEPHIPPSQRPTYRAFRRQAKPGYDCLMVPFAGMWLGIEPDGYTHS